MKCFRVFILTILVVSVFSSCRKEDDLPAPVYSPEIEAAQIHEWLESMKTNKVNVDTLANGVYLIVDTPGTGVNVKTGNSVTVKYTGYLLNGYIFDSSLLHGDGTMTYIHKNTDPKMRLIPGWELGIEHLNKGSKALIFISSDLAYGADGNGGVPPYTPLIFVIEVVDIK